jgi:hypothetical protein
MNRSFSKIRHIKEANEKLESRLLSEQDSNQGQAPVNKDEQIKNLGLTQVDQAFKKNGFQRNDSPARIRSMYQYVVTYDKKPSYSGNITSDGNAGLRILESTPLKDSVLQKCKAKTHSLDENYIILDNNNADCVLSTLTKQATT